MPRTLPSSPPFAPGVNRSSFLVLDDLGQLGRVYR
jgi:hypothetical protein